MHFGYTVFAIQDGGQCFGSPTAQSTYAKYGTSTKCSHGKGGPMANNVYRMKNGRYILFAIVISHTCRDS